MTQARSPKRNTSGVTGIKMLITASALAATVGGWSALAFDEHRNVVALQPAPAPVIAAAQANVSPPVEAAVIAVDFPPVPTLVPRPEVTVVARQQSNNQQAVYVQPAPQPQVAAAPVLRSVGAPPSRASSGQQVQAAAAPGVSAPAAPPAPTGGGTGSSKPKP